MIINGKWMSEPEIIALISQLTAYKKRLERQLAQRLRTVKTMPETKLLPCPFCGGKAKYESDLNIVPLIDENGAYVDYDRMDYWERVYCTECGAEIVSNSEDEEEEITIKKWNRRTDTKDEAWECQGNIGG